MEFNKEGELSIHFYFKDKIFYLNETRYSDRAKVTPSLGAPVSSQTIRGCLGEGHLGSRCPLRVLPLTPTHRRLRLEWCCAKGNWTAVEWNQVIFSDKSRFNLSSHVNRVRVWRPRGECLNPVFALQRHTAPKASPARSPDLSPIEYIWDHLGWQFGHVASSNEPEARLQQIWNDMSQDIIQNVNASMPDRIASCIPTRVGSTGY
ncbi:transposable element Tcb2 transposase [Trichonephila clavipes]|nr:transposable element Tcb2 transposase [Trichonephila clavipes]